MQEPEQNSDTPETPGALREFIYSRWGTRIIAIAGACVMTLLVVFGASGIVNGGRSVLWLLDLQSHPAIMFAIAGAAGALLVWRRLRIMTRKRRTQSKKGHSDAPLPPAV
mgnify:FL=1